MARKTREAHWKKRLGMRRRLLAAGASFGEDMERVRWLYAWDIRAWTVSCVS